MRITNGTGLLVAVCLAMLAGQAVCAPAAPPQTFVRFKPLNMDGAYAQVSMTIHRVPWRIDYYTWPRGADNYARVRVQKNSYCPWLQVAPDWGTVTLAFIASAPVRGAQAEIQLASQGDDGAVFKTLTVQETGNIISVVLPPNFREKPDGILALRQVSAMHLKTSADAAASPPPTTRFSFYTGGAAGFKALYTDPQILRNELTALRNLGINGLSYPMDPDYLAIAEQLGFRHYMSENWGCDPGQAANEKAVAIAAGAPRALQKIELVALADEPGNAGLSQVGAKTEDYHAFLAAQGLTPADFNAVGWADVSPITDERSVAEINEDWGRKRGEAASKSYYWTYRFGKQLTSDDFKSATARVDKLYPPGTLGFVNYTDHPLILDGGMLSSPDWFEMGLQRATSQEWTEDWMYESWASWGNGLFERIGFLMDILHAAASRAHQPLGMYNTMDGADGLRLKSFCAIGHGAKVLHYFDYGPTYAATENYWSDSPSSYRGIAKIIRDEAKADDLIYPGQPPSPRVAIVYSTTQEIWDENPILSQERQLLHIALNQENYPADIIDEELLRDRDLSRYQVIYLADNHLPLDCQLKLKQWTEAGGLLCLTAGAARKDEYDRDSPVIAPLLGLDETGGQLPDGDNHVALAGAGAAPTPVSLIYYKPRLTHVTARVLGAFDDGSPAITVNACGKGRILSYDFMPGNSFLKSIAAANPSGPVATFPDAGRALITLPCRMAGVPRPVEIAAAAVEGDLLVSPNGAALVMANYTRKNIAALKVTVYLPGVKTVSSVEQGTLPFTRSGNGVSFTMPMGLTDIVMLRR